MFTSMAHPNSRNNQNASLKNYVSQVPRGFSLHVFKQPPVSSFSYNAPATTKFDLGYHNVDPNWYYSQQVQQQPTTKSYPVSTNTRNPRASSADAQRNQSQFRASGSFAVYPNGIYQRTPSIDTASSATFSPSIFSSAVSTDTAASSVVDEPAPPRRSNTPAPSSAPSSLHRSPAISRAQSRSNGNQLGDSYVPPPAPAPRSAMLPNAVSPGAIIRAPSYGSAYDVDESYMCRTPATIGSILSEDSDDELDLLARRNAELNSIGSRRDSMTLPMEATSTSSGQIFPTIPISASPEPMPMSNPTGSSEPPNPNHYVIPFPSSMINHPDSRLVSDDDQFIPPLANSEWDIAPIERPESRAERRRSYAAVLTGQKSNNAVPPPPAASSELRQLSVPPPMTRKANVSIAASDGPRPFSQEPTFLSSTTPDRPHSRATSITHDASFSSRRNSATINHNVITANLSAVPGPVQNSHVAPSIRSRKSSLSSDPMTRRSSQSPEARAAMSASYPPPSRSTTPFRGEPGSRASYIEPVLPRRHSDGDVPASHLSVAQYSAALGEQVDWVHGHEGMPMTHEPQRRHSDGDQYRRTVRWNENLICPSPVFPDQRRKGWFNRRGDQLWTNSGTYMPATRGQEFPPDLDGYPDYGQGWMNESGVRIDMMHRLIPKLPLRSALKQSRT